MAVKPEQIKASVKAKYPNANLSTKRLDALAAKLANKPADDADDAAIDLVLEDFNGILSFEEIAKEDDRVRTLENKPEPKPTPAPEPKPNDPPAPKDTNQQLLEAIAKLTTEVSEIKSGKITDTKRTTAQQAFEKSEVLKGMKPEVKENWLKRVVVTAETTDEEIAAQVTSLETEFTDLTQSFADSVGYTGPPSTGLPDGKPSADTVKSVVDGLI